MTTTITLNDIKANFNEVTTNIIDGMDLFDYNHQCADGDANVIYYAQANDKVHNATADQLEQAEDQYKEYGFEFIDLQDLNTKLAFFIVLAEYQEQHEKEIQEDIEALNDFMIDHGQGEELEQADDICSILQELV